VTDSAGFPPFWEREFADGTWLIASPCTGSAAQRWRITR
jgi:hypothetical protein